MTDTPGRESRASVPEKSRNRSTPPYIFIARNLLWDHKHRERMGIAVWTYAQLLDLRTHANGQVLWGRCLTTSRWANILKCPLRTVQRDFHTLREGTDPYVTAHGGRGLGLALTIRKSKGWRQDPEAARRTAEIVVMLERIQAPHLAVATATKGGSNRHYRGGQPPHAAVPIIREGNEASPRGSTTETKEGAAAVSSSADDAVDALQRLEALEAQGDRGAGRLRRLLIRQLAEAQIPDRSEEEAS